MVTDKDKKKVLSIPVGHEEVSTDYIVRKFQAFARLAEAIGNGEYETREGNPFIIGNDIAVSEDLTNFFLFTRGEAFVIDCEEDVELHSLVSAVSHV